LFTKKPHVPAGSIDLHCGLRRPKLVFLKELVCDLADGTSPFASNVSEVIEAFLKFAATNMQAQGKCGLPSP
jgi:hypothetical protein